METVTKKGNSNARYSFKELTIGTPQETTGKGKKEWKLNLWNDDGKTLIATLWGVDEMEVLDNAARLIKANKMHDEMISVLKKTKKELERLKAEMIKPSGERDSFWISTFFQSPLGGCERLREIDELLEQAEKE